MEVEKNKNTTGLTPAQLARTLQTPRDFENHYALRTSAISFKDGLPHEQMKKQGFEHDFKTMYDAPIEEVIPTHNAVESSDSVALREMLYRLKAAKALDLGLACMGKMAKLDPKLQHRGSLMEDEQNTKEKTFDTSRKATTLELQSLTTFLTNPFLPIFTSIRDLRARRLAEKYENPNELTAGSKSGEADEDKPERGSEELLHRLMDVILLFFAQETDHQDWLRSTPTPRSLQIPLRWPKPPLTATDKMHIPTVLYCTAIDDGYLYLSRAGKTTGSNRFSEIPVIRYEAKRLDTTVAYGVDPAEVKGATTSKKLKKTKAPTAAQHKVTAQQVAEMLTCIFANRDYAYKRVRDQRARKDSLKRSQEEMTRAAKLAAEKQKVTQRRKSAEHEVKDRRLSAGRTKRATVRENIKEAELDKLKAAQRKSTRTPKPRQLPMGTLFESDEEVPASESEDSSEGDEEMGDEDWEPHVKKLRVTDAQPDEFTEPLGPQKDSSKDMSSADFYDQETFTIYIRHTYLSIARLHASGKYLDDVQTLDCLTSDQEMVHFKRTKEFNLLYSTQREEAGKAIWGLLMYLHSRQAKIGRLQAADREGLAITIPGLIPMSEGSKEREPRDKDRDDGKKFPSEDKAPFQPRGLYNGNLYKVENFCYMNSALQALAAVITPTGLYELAEECEDSDSVFGKFLLITMHLCDGGRIPMKPENFSKAFSDAVAEADRINDEKKGRKKMEIEDKDDSRESGKGKAESTESRRKRWTGQRQEDVEDFVATLLEHLDMVSPPVQRLFTVKHHTDIRCSGPRCKGQAPTLVENWHSLRLHVPLGDTAIDVQMLLDNYLIELDTTQTISCDTLVPKCRSQTGVERRTIPQMPPILIAQLDRQHFVSEDDVNAMLDVLFGDDLMQNVEVGAMKNDRAVELFHNDEPTLNVRGKLYDLYAMICHIGSGSGGHYVAYVMYADDRGRQRWFRCNDNIVTPVNIRQEAESLKADKGIVLVERNKKEVVEWCWQASEDGTPALLLYRERE